ncbi:uncharacterized protein BT62DRAFT_924669 [Guyanagaster necrorhizus]|uniref:Uncharacterized protein n=1 Tax=Guyanagaster necrorhizus TaxID=856835 RepID=A0A9P8AM41_9AGAR|nr:uncharacterized protein BT62DRAFT_924669 [Guyanagaster necrorhizus MCA 3950]KAG7439477.1 hypothetical protein BT62DRAFT_924669 [Guyanagaster necrorhizus MCA 3950]
MAARLRPLNPSQSSFQFHYTHAPHLEHRFTDCYPRINQEKIYPNPAQRIIQGLLFHLNGSDPIPVPLLFIHQYGNNGRIVDCILLLDHYFHWDQLACQRVCGEGNLPVQIWYHRMQMLPGINDPNSLNGTIAGLIGSQDQRKLWYGPIITLILRDAGSLKEYRDVEGHHLNVLRRLFQV